MNASLRDTFSILGSAQNLPIFSTLSKRAAQSNSLRLLRLVNAPLRGTFTNLGNAQELTALLRSLLLLKYNKLTKNIIKHNNEHVRKQLHYHIVNMHQ